MSSVKYIGNNRFDTKVTVKSGGAEVTGSLNVEGSITEKGYSILVLMQKMVVDRLGDDGESVDFLNFVPITDNNDEVVVI
jgi:hypothetical protein